MGGRLSDSLPRGDGGGHYGGKVYEDEDEGRKEDS